MASEHAVSGDSRNNSSNESGIFNSKSMESSGISQYVDQFKLSSPDYEPIEDQQLGDRALDVSDRDENALLSPPSTSSAIPVNAVVLRGTPSTSSGNISKSDRKSKSWNKQKEKKYDGFIQ